jgi:transcriptional regulator with XRE-family HTH domain
MSTDERNTAKALGRRIRAAREAAGLKQVELARRCGVISTTAWRWEDGRAEPALPMLRVIASETGADLGWLVRGDAA